MSDSTTERSTDTSECESFECTHCSHVWRPRKPGTAPVSCPYCRSTLWMRPIIHRTCTRCGHEWDSPSHNVRRCPECRSYRWAEGTERYSCGKCSYAWIGRAVDPPKRCPHCRSTIWNTGVRAGISPGAYEPAVSSMHSAAVGAENIEKILRSYRKGSSCTSISISLDISFDVVYDIVSNEYPLAEIRT